MAPPGPQSSLSFAGRSREIVRNRARRWLDIGELMPTAGRTTLIASIFFNLALGTLPIGFIVAMSVLLGRLRGEAGLTNGWSPLVGVFTIAVAAFLVHQLLVPFQTGLGEIVSRTVDGYCLQRLMTAALYDAPIGALEDQASLDLLHDARTAFEGGLPTPGDAVAGALALIARYAQLLSAVVLVGVMLSPVAGVLAGCTALVIRFGQRGSLGRWSTLWKGLSPQRRAMGYVLEMLTGPGMAKEIRVLGLLPWARDRLRSETMRYLTPLWSGRRRLLFWPFIGLALIGLAGGCLVLSLLAHAASAHDLSVLQFVVSLQGVLILMRFGVYFPESDSQTQMGMQAYTSLRHFEEFATARQNSGGSPRVGRREISAPAAAIRFENVRFQYSATGPEVLQGLDLTLAAGKSTAIVGLNGAGKTTLVKLLAGFYAPTSGRVTVDGLDLAAIDSEEWQRHIAVIFQDYIRYELTAAENIGMGAPQRMGERSALASAAEKAGAVDVLAGLPLGADTVLSRAYAGGRDLSGGQWQRIALARAFFAVEAGATVLVLDEPTAQLDVRAEVEFFDRFLETTQGLTSVIISHRFSTVRRADQILVIEHGRVVERGDHDELMEISGRYADLFNLQAKRFTDEPDAGPGANE